MYCKAAFRSKLPSLFVEQSVRVKINYNESFCVLYGVAKFNYEYQEYSS